MKSPYCKSIEPELAEEPLPFDIFRDFEVVWLITEDSLISVPLMLIAPVLADAFLPIAAFVELIVVVASINVDLSIFGHSAMVVSETMTTAKPATAVDNLFMFDASLFF
ncbi:MAG: hypothetical protein ACRERV_02425 [Methylococcales bacterium]